MSETTLLMIIIAALIALFVLYKFLKPYILKYDTTLFLTGGLGSGKTLTGVKTSIIMLRKLRVKVNIMNKIILIKNSFRKLYNKSKQKEYNKKVAIINASKVLTEDAKKKSISTLAKKTFKQFEYKHDKPKLYSNFPIHFKTSLFSKKREWSTRLKAEHLLLFEPITEYSVVFADEIAQFLSQYDWKEETVQNNFTEFVTFYRHYVGGNLVITSQSTSEIVAPLRRKANQATWCFNFKKHLFGLFYTMECCDIMLSDDISTTTTSQVGDNTRKLYKLFPPKGTYDSRWARNRYKNICKDRETEYKKLQSNEILRLRNYISPCDDSTTNEERAKLKNKALERK